MVKICKFDKSYNRILFGRETLCTERYRGGTHADNFFNAIFYGKDNAELRPSSIQAFFEIKFEFEEKKQFLTKELMFVKLQFFKKYQDKDFMGNTAL